METFFTVTEQTKLFLLSCLFGLPLGLFYDVFRVLRLCFPHPKLLVMLEDIFVMGVFAAFIGAFSVYFARGEFRVYYIVGSLCGFTVYYFTFGALLISIAGKIAAKVRNAACKVFRVPSRFLTVLYKKRHSFLRVLHKFHKNADKRPKHS